jgi:hypothetical protein
LLRKKIRATFVAENNKSLSKMSNELTYDERKAWAKDLYTRLDVSVEDIALTISVDEDEVCDWIKEEAWDGMKRSLLISKKVQLAHLYSLLGQINTKITCAEEIAVKDVDLFIKYTTAIRNLEADMPVSGIIEVAEGFVMWLRRRDVDLAKQVTVQLDLFIKERMA